MRKHCNVEEFRIRNKPGVPESVGLGNTGMFIIPYGNFALGILAHDGTGVEWEHVSVVVRSKEGIALKRCPTWEEMCFVKNKFWYPDEAVGQFHPPQSEYVNKHPYCLHLWKRVGKTFELPPMEMVG